MDVSLRELDHPAWLTALGTAVGWGLMLALVTALLFVLPFLLWP